MGRQRCVCNDCWLFRISVTYKLRSDTGVIFPVSAQAVMTWPSVTAEDTLKFPLTHIGNKSVKKAVSVVHLSVSVHCLKARQ